MNPPRYFVYQMSSPADPAYFSVKKLGLLARAKHPVRASFGPVSRARFFVLEAALAIALVLAVTTGRARAESVPIQTILNPVEAPSAYVAEGQIIAIDGDDLVVGVPRDLPDSITSGAVKIYNRKGGLTYLLPNPDPVEGELFGSSIAVSGGLLAVGTSTTPSVASFNPPRPGKVYLYRLSDLSTAKPFHILQSPTPTDGDLFGSSLSISQGRLIVGASGRPKTGDVGAAYVYAIDGRNVSPPVVLQHSAPFAGARFGTSVAISGLRCAVGAAPDPNSSKSPGSVFVFDLSAAEVPPLSVTEIGATRANDFGAYIALDGSRLVVGAPYTYTSVPDGGRIYAYDLSSGNPAAPLLIDAPIPKAKGHFGSAIALAGNRLVAGISGQYFPPEGPSGFAYVYDLASATPAAPRYELQDDHVLSDDYYGAGVAIQGNTVLVGAPGDGTIAVDAGGTYLYDLQAEKPGKATAFLNVPSRGVPTQFGAVVAASAKWLVVGASAEARVYVYDRTSSSQPRLAFVLGSTDSVLNSYGSSLAISGSRLVVGDPAYVDANPSPAAGPLLGAVHVYDLEGYNPAVPYLVLKNERPGSGHDFASALALSGTRLAIGFPGDDSDPTYRGSVLLYDVGPKNFEPVATLLHPPAGSTDIQFGRSLALSADTLVIGSPLEPNGHGSLGTARVYTLDASLPPTLSSTLENQAPTSPTYLSLNQPVALAGPFVVLGVPDVGGKGRVYVSSPAGLRTLQAPAGMEWSAFGTSLAASGSHLVIGAPNDDATGPSPVYVYELSSSLLGVPVQILREPSSPVDAGFGDGLAIVGDNLLVGAPNGGWSDSHYGAAYLYDITGSTIPPLLNLPVRDSISRSPLQVSFTLPENALAGSVTLGFSAIYEEVPARVLTLPDVQAAGTYAFALNTARPDRSAEGVTVTGPAIPDGYYNLTLTYQDASGNPSASVVVENIVIDNQAPVIAWPLPPQVVYADATGHATVEDYRWFGIDDLTFGSIEQTPAPGTAIAPGTHSLDFRVTDAVGFVTLTHSTLTVRYQPAAQTEITVTATASPANAPSSVPAAPAGPPAGTVLRSFGPPAIDGYRDLVAHVKMTHGRTLLEGIEILPQEGDPSLLAYTDMAAPGIENATFTTFLDPVFDAQGGVAFAARIRGAGGRAANDQGVWTNAFGSGLELVLHEGAPVPGLDGARLKSVTSMALRDGKLLALLTLLPEKGLATAADDTALVLLTGAGQGTVLLREGHELSGVPFSKIKSMNVLAPASGSPGQGRWFGASSVLAKVTLADGRTFLVQIAADGTAVPALSSADPATAVDARAQWKSFGIPAQSDFGNLALAATLRPRAGVVTGQDDQVLLYRPAGGNWLTLARENQPINEFPNAPRFASFSDPVVNDAGQVAFVATLRGTVVSAGFNVGLFCGTPGALRQIDLFGSGKKLVGFALPGGNDSRVVYQTSAPQGWVGLYVEDASLAGVRELLGAGRYLTPGGPILTGIELLKATPGSYGAARSYNSAGSVAVLATFADRTQVILRIDVP